MAGAGYKLFNTGDVLTAAQVNTYLMEQSVMVFANAAARTTALSGVVAEGMLSYLKDTDAVEVYNGSAWVASDDPNAIQNTIVDAKGDLIAASANDTPARLAVGNNGETLLADSAATTGLRWQGNFAAGKNKIINGDFNIWQRGTSFAGLTANTYTADRWLYEPSGATATVSQQAFTAGTAPVAGYESQYFLRCQITAADDNWRMVQRMEDVRTLANQTVTVSFWAKADSAKVIQVALRQDFGSGGSTAVETSSGDITLSTAWTRYSVTLSNPSISGKTIGAGNFLAVWFISRVNQTATLDLWGIQVEAGSVATAFQTATGTLAGELAACQRYYYRQGGDSVYQTVGTGWAVAASGAAGIATKTIFPVAMRVTPTSIDYSTLIYFDQVNAGIATGSISLVSNQSSRFVGYVSSGSITGATQYRSYDLATNNSTSGYLGFSAEL